MLMTSSSWTTVQTVNYLVCFNVHILHYELNFFVRRGRLDGGRSGGGGGGGEGRGEDHRGCIILNKLEEY